MDAKKKIGKFLQHVSYLVLGSLLLAAALPFLAVFLVGCGVGTDRAVPFSETAEPQTYATIEIIGLSSLRIDEGGATYYLTLDTDYSLHILRLRDSLAKKLSRHIEYIRNPSMPAPCPSRLYGIVRPLPPAVCAELTESFNLPGELESDESLNCLDVLFAPDLIDMDLFFRLFFCFALCGLGFVGQFLHDKRITRRCLSRLSKTGSLEKAADELDAPNNIVFCKGNVILSRSFIFCRYSGVVVRYDDLVWCYSREVWRQKDAARIYLVGHTREKKKLVLAGAAGREKKNPAGQLKPIEDVIRQRNPQILQGRTPENRAAYDEICQKQQ